MPNLDTRTTKTPAVDDYTYLLSNDGTVEGKVELQDITVIPETSRAINFTSSQTASQIQADIDAVGKFIPEGVVITFQFADGTYSLDGSLNFFGFYGGGAILIYGNTSEGHGLSTSQNVHLNFNNDSTGIYVRGCKCRLLQIYNIKCTVNDSRTAIQIFGGTVAFTQIRSCYLINTGKSSSNSRGCYVNEASNAYIQDTYFSNNHAGIQCNNNSRVGTQNCDETGTDPNYGIVAGVNSTIGKVSGTVITGSIADESVANGGEIR